MIFLVLVLTTPALSAPPNILYILADDLGYEDVGFHGSDILTPNLDTLAREGVELENHYVMPLCAPTRASLMTGRQAYRTGFWFANLRPNAEFGMATNVTTIPQMLKTHGYGTHMIGKWHLGMARRAMTPVRRGFDTFLGQYQGSSDYFTHTVVGGYDLRLNYMEQGRMVDEILVDHNGTYATEIFTHRTLELLHKQELAEVPWFIYLAYTAPHKGHHTYDAPPEDLELYSSHMVHSTVRRKKYATMISVMDRGVGQIIRTLKDLGYYDNTVIVFSSDNGGVRSAFKGTWKPGEASNFPLRGGKATYYEGGVRGVCFVHSPLLSKTSYVNRNLHHVTDWFPTFEALAQEAPNVTESSYDVDGVNIWRSISGGEAVRQEVLINMVVNHKVFYKAAAGDENYTFIGRSYNGPTTSKVDQGQYLSNGTVFHLTEIKNETSRQRLEAKILSRIDSNSLLVYRSYKWKLILGGIAPSGWTAAKAQEVEPWPPFNHAEDVYMKLFNNACIKKIQLYDVEADPGEHHNVAQQNPDVTTRITNKVMTILKNGYHKIRWMSMKYDLDFSGLKNGTWKPWIN